MGIHFPSIFLCFRINLRQEIDLYTWSWSPESKYHHTTLRRSESVLRFGDVPFWDDDLYCGRDLSSPSCLARTLLYLASRTVHKEINTVNLIVGADPTIGLWRENSGDTTMLDCSTTTARLLDHHGSTTPPPPALPQLAPPPPASPPRSTTPPSQSTTTAPPPKFPYLLLAKYTSITKTTITT
ncbi:hypothetical protein Tco_1017861 [Tanacetum coccineum]|uniref:Uncharacterized protein n=1 Tax=Tanacetum coccineum TaxID=301880 RepID=A0ABQ5FSQ1_9ASTR